MTTGVKCFVARLANEERVGESRIMAFAASFTVYALPWTLAGFQRQLAAKVHAGRMSASSAVLTSEQLFLFSLFVDSRSHEAVIAFERGMNCCCVAASCGRFSHCHRRGWSGWSLRRGDDDCRGRHIGSHAVGEGEGNGERNWVTDETRRASRWSGGGGGCSNNTSSCGVNVGVGCDASIRML